MPVLVLISQQVLLHTYNYIFDKFHGIQKMASKVYLPSKHIKYILDWSMSLVGTIWVNF